MKKIDWDKQYRAVIQRVFERGNAEEKQQALEFYGKQKVMKVTGSANLDGFYIPVMAHANEH